MVQADLAEPVATVDLVVRADQVVHQAQVDPVDPVDLVV